MNTRTVTELLGRLALLKFFPSDPQARAYLVEMVCEMATTEDQVKWMVKRAVQLYREWPGPLELRALFCSKFRPADGVNAYSEVYLNGIPSEDPMREQRLIEASMAEGKRKQIAGPVSECPVIGGAVSEVAQLMRQPKRPAASIKPRIPETRQEAATKPPITQADIDRAVAELRRKRLEAETGGTIQ